MAVTDSDKDVVGKRDGLGGRRPLEEGRVRKVAEPDGLAAVKCVVGWLVV